MTMMNMKMSSVEKQSQASDDDGDDGWREGFKDGFEDMARQLVNKMQILFCLNGLEGIGEGSDDGCDDEETASSKLACRLFSTQLGFDEEGLLRERITVNTQKSGAMLCKRQSPFKSEQSEGRVLG